MYLVREDTFKMSISQFQKGQASLTNQIVDTKVREEYT